MNTLYDVIKKSRLTEKNNKLQETQNTVVFTVAGTANKIQIKAAVEKLFKVKVAKVATRYTVWNPSETSSTGRRQIGRASCRERV